MNLFKSKKKEEPKKKVTVTIEQLTMLFMKSKEYINLDRQKKINEAIQQENKLLSMLKAPQRNRKDEEVQIIKIVNIINTIEAYDKAIIQIGNIDQFKSQIVASQGDPNRVLQFMPYIASVCYYIENTNDLRGAVDLKSQLNLYYGCDIANTYERSVDPSAKLLFGILNLQSPSVQKYAQDFSKKYQVLDVPGINYQSQQQQQTWIPNQYPPNQQGGYPQQGGQGGYPQQGGQGGYPQQGGQGGYPQQGGQGGYPQFGGYQQQGSYQQQQNGFPQQGGYPQQQSGFPQQGGYSQQQSGFPQQGGYSQQQSGFPQQGGYSQQQSGFPQQGGYPQNNGFQQAQQQHPQQQQGNFQQSYHNQSQTQTSQNTIIPNTQQNSNPYGQIQQFNQHNIYSNNPAAFQPQISQPQIGINPKQDSNYNYPQPQLQPSIYNTQKTQNNNNVPQQQQFQSQQEQVDPFAILNQSNNIKMVELPPLPSQTIVQPNNPLDQSKIGNGIVSEQSPSKLQNQQNQNETDNFGSKNPLGNSQISRQSNLTDPLSDLNQNIFETTTIGQDMIQSQPIEINEGSHYVKVEMNHDLRSLEILHKFRTGFPQSIIQSLEQLEKVGLSI